MKTDTQIQRNNDENETEAEVKPTVEMPEYKYRAMFRPTLMRFFEQTNKKNGAYRWAEEQAFQFFETVYKIPRTAWNYRTGKGGH